MYNIKQKVIVLDEGVLSARSITSWGSVKLKILNGLLPPSTFLPPVPYIWFSMAISALKRIGVNKDDLILIARDKTTSFRKFFYPNYKAQRWEQREKQSHIDWRHHYGILDKFLDQINESTNWHILWHPNLWLGADLLFTQEGQQFINEEELDLETLNKNFSIEADDWIACASKFYKDKDVVFVSIDADLDQLCVRENTKYFTLTQKYKNAKGVYKDVKNGYQVLEKKIEKGDVSDNILPGITDNNNAKDKEIRKLIIDLINLPSWVEEPAFKILENLPTKEMNYDLLPFPDSLAKKFDDIYKIDNIITVEECIKYYEKKKVKVAKKAKEKREQKKLDKIKLTMT